jgi:hypothetical protein
MTDELCFGAENLQLRWEAEAPMHVLRQLVCAWSVGEFLAKVQVGAQDARRAAVIAILLAIEPFNRMFEARSEQVEFCEASDQPGATCGPIE